MMEGGRQADRVDAASSIAMKGGGADRASTRAGTEESLMLHGHNQLGSAKSAARSGTAAQRRVNAAHRFAPRKTFFSGRELGPAAGRASEPGRSSGQGPGGERNRSSRWACQAQAWGIIVAQATRERGQG